MVLVTGFFERRMTAKRTPSTRPRAMDVMLIQTVLTTPRRMVGSNSFSGTVAQRTLPCEKANARATTRPMTTTPLIQRP